MAIPHKHHRFRTATGPLLLLLVVLVCAFPLLAADVWVNTGSGVYHCPGGQYYGATKRGRYMPETEAVQHCYRAAYGRACSPAQANAARQAIIGNLLPAASHLGPATRAWINTSSHVYHCPGTRYYGATQKGRYASEPEAIATGNRPAYGARCN